MKQPKKRKMLMACLLTAVLLCFAGQTVPVAASSEYLAGVILEETKASGYDTYGKLLKAGDTVDFTGRTESIRGCSYDPFSSHPLDKASADNRVTVRDFKDAIDEFAVPESCFTGFYEARPESVSSSLGTVMGITMYPALRLASVADATVSPIDEEVTFTADIKWSEDLSCVWGYAQAAPDKRPAGSEDYLYYIDPDDGNRYRFISFINEKGDPYTESSVTLQKSEVQGKEIVLLLKNTYGSFLAFSNRAAMETAPAQSYETVSQNMNTEAELLWKGKKISLSWGAASEASGYDIFIAGYKENLTDACLLKTVPAGTTRTKLAKAGKKKLKLNGNYQVKVKAFKDFGRGKQYIGETMVFQIAGPSSKFTNASKLTLNKKKVTLEGGKKFRLVPKTIKPTNLKKLLYSNEAPYYRYLSTDTSVARVNKSGKITAASKGSCFVYVFAGNGAKARIKVNVK